MSFRTGFIMEKAVAKARKEKVEKASTQLAPMGRAHLVMAKEAVATWSIGGCCKLQEMAVAMTAPGNSVRDLACPSARSSRRPGATNANRSGIGHENALRKERCLDLQPAHQHEVS